MENAKLSPSSSERNLALQELRRQTQLLEQILDLLNDFATIFLRARFPHGKATDRFASRTERHQ